MTQVGDDLREAAEAVNRLGWIRGAAQRAPGGPVCLAGALTYAILETDDVANAQVRDPEENFRWKLAYDAVRNTLDDMSPIHWNDHFAKDADEVVHTLKLAAELADEAP